MDIQWVLTDKKNQIYLSQDIVTNFSSKEKIEIQFGQWKCEVSVELNADLPINTIAISKDIMERYNIPMELPYEIVIDNNTIKIGPVIGIMISYKRFFNQERIGRTIDYKNIKGLLFVCRLKDINLEEKTINGYYYNPSGKTQKTQWLEGTFPFPDVIYNRRKKLPVELYNRLTQHDVEVFNSHYLNKWQQFEVFSENPNLESFLPKTTKLSKSSLIKMLENYNEIYVKPTTRANGEGIRVIEKKENGYSLKENDSSSQSFFNVNSLYKALKRKNYVLQQSVAYKTENRNVDFRVVLQKDATKQWNSPGFTCKVSNENSIITNFHNRYTMLSGLEALTSIYHLSPEQAKEKEKEMVQLCESLAETIEEKGVHLGDVAFDIIVDSNLKLWVLEIQIRYRAFRKREIDAELYYKSMVTPLYYAKALAGF
ncbi:YheC/YheD family protein [Viridibacillus sp. NPDC093762]|uniref:YheC/YheD family endospore coat-associated protein n=1 Tax=Viridibacillus sp. NPDC093762 TaxID=3390720 RepID=UPI003D02E982